MKALKIVGLVLAGLLTAGVLFVALLDINTIKGVSGHARMPNEVRQVAGA